MGIYSKGVYPELSYKERRENNIFARTWDSLIQTLRLRDASEGEVPTKIADENEQQSMNWFLS